MFPSWFIVLICLYSTVNGKVVIDFYEEIFNCNKKGEAGFFDLSGLELFVDDSYKTYVNGTWKFLKDVKSPWNWHIYAEEFERGEWNIRAVNRNISDMCPTLHSPLEPWYKLYKDQPGCPIKVGVTLRKKLKFDFHI
jgi:hypothetical protein